MFKDALARFKFPINQSISQSDFISDSLALAHLHLKDRQTVGKKRKRKGKGKLGTQSLNLVTNSSSCLSRTWITLFQKNNSADLMICYILAKTFVIHTVHVKTEREKNLSRNHFIANQNRYYIRSTSRLCISLFVIMFLLLLCYHYYGE